jgi:hypothetical protein
VFDIQGDAQSTYTHGVLSELMVDHDEDLFFRFQVGLRDVPPKMDEPRPHTWPR